MIERVAQDLGNFSEPRKLPIDKTIFNFLPKQLEEVRWTEDDEFKQIYNECYNIIFHGQHEPDSLHKRPGLREFVTAEAQKVKCPVRLFILTVMWGHREKNPSRFYCTMLGGEAAARRVMAYRAPVEKEYGSFNEKTFDEYAMEAIGGKSNSNQLLDAETLAGRWVVGYKIKRGGPVEKYFYECNEFVLPELWLAIEPSYRKILTEWSKDRKGTPEQNKKRVRVAKLINELQRQSKRAVSIFKAREAVMPMAIKRVLADHTFSPQHFQINEGQQYTDVFQFWSRLGMAIQHLWCWEYAAGNRKAASKQLGVGTFQM